MFIPVCERKRRINLMTSLRIMFALVGLMGEGNKYCCASLSREGVEKENEEGERERCRE